MGSPNVVDLPTETLELVLQHVPAEDICSNIRRTSKRFHELSYSNAFFKRYLDKQFNYRPISRDPIPPWKRALAIDVEERRWSEESAGLLRYRSEKTHIATIDALRLHKTRNGVRLAFTGSRDRHIRVWDVAKVHESNNSASWVVAEAYAHQGWIWGVMMADDDQTVFSTGFDHFLKQYQVTESALKVVAEREYETALCKCHTEGNLVYVTGIKSGVHLVDHRAGLLPQQTISQLGSYNLAMLATTSARNELFTADNERKIFFQLDKRQFRLANRFSIPPQFPCCSMSMDATHLLLSSKKGEVLYFDPETKKLSFKWSPQKDYDFRAEVMYVVNTISAPGVVFYATAFELSAFMPGSRPKLYGNLKSYTAFMNLDYLDGDLVATTADGDVRFWPKEFKDIDLVPEARSVGPNV